jgi:hypothetical protein
MQENWTLLHSCVRVHTQLCRGIGLCCTVVYVCTHSYEGALDFVVQLCTCAHTAMQEHWTLFYSCVRVHTQLCKSIGLCCTVVYVCTHSCAGALESVLQLCTCAHTAMKELWTLF